MKPSALKAPTGRNITARGNVPGFPEEKTQALKGRDISMAKHATSVDRSGWTIATLGDICEIQLGKMLSPAAKTGARPVKYLRNANVQWARFDLSDVAEMDFSEREEAKLSLRPGDLLVCEGGEPGRAAVWGGEVSRCCYQKALHRLRPRGDAADSCFLMYRLWHGALKSEFSDSNAKTTIAHLPAVRLQRLPIPLPPLAEQRRLAGLLREQLFAVAEARTSLQAQIKSAAALPAALLRDVFENEETSAWPQRRLGDVLSLRSEIIHPRVNPRGDAMFVGLEHIEPHTGQRIGGIGLRKENLTGRKAQFHAGDIVYGYLRPYLNKVWLADFTGLCSVDQYVFTVPPDRADNRFVAWFMRSPRYLGLAPISAQPGQLPRIRTEEVAAVPIPLPPLATQRALAARLDKSFAEVSALRAGLESRLAAVERLPAALLREVFGS